MNLDRAAEWAAAVDYDLRFGLVALGGTRQAMVGHATWSRSDPADDRAEVAFEIADAYQGNGLGPCSSRTSPKRPRSAGGGAEVPAVQSMAPAGVEMLVGVAHDALFGPVIACGAGGVTAEVMKDVAVRITPLTDRDAAGMIASLRSFPLLDGFRGGPRVASPGGAVIVDARVRVEGGSAARPQPKV